MYVDTLMRIFNFSVRISAKCKIFRNNIHVTQKTKEAAKSWVERHRTIFILLCDLLPYEEGIKESSEEDKRKE